MRDFRFFGIGFAGGGDEPPSLIPESAVIKALFFGEVARLSNGGLAVNLGFSVLDTRGVPEDDQIYISLRIEISGPKASDDKWVTLLFRPVKSGYGQAELVPGGFEPISLERGQYISAARGTISVFHDNTPLVTFDGGGAPVLAEETVHFQRPY